jgi:hypothetical protein
MRDPNYIELEETPGNASIEGTVDQVAKRWLGMPAHINLEIHPRIMEAFATTPAVADSFIACGVRAPGLTDDDRAQLNQFAALLQAIGRMKKEQANGGI